MTAPNPYGDDLADREPLAALAETPERIRQTVGRWTSEQFERSYAPGKWSARRLLVHLVLFERLRRKDIRAVKDGLAAKDPNAGLSARRFRSLRLRSGTPARS